MCKKIILSPLARTWVLDLDGTLVKHNGYKIDGEDSLLPGAMEFLANIDSEDMVIILTSRSRKLSDLTIDFLEKQKIRYDYIVFDVPYGERIIVNDRKLSGLSMAIAIDTERNVAPAVSFQIDKML